MKEPDMVTARVAPAVLRRLAQQGITGWWLEYAVNEGLRLYLERKRMQDVLLRANLESLVEKAGQS